MPPSVALCLTCLLIGWLFYQDRKAYQGASGALWIPLVWACIVGSKPLSLWLGIQGDVGADGFVQDSLLDKALYLVLMLGAVFILMSRRVGLSRVISSNKWLFFFFMYLGVSVLWSDEPIVSFKRWIKDLGNVIMVLVVMSEANPAEARRALLARLAYVMIPLSVLVVKYYPAISRNYDQWTFRVHTVGIATNKNIFAMTLFVCGLALCWMLLELRDTGGWRKQRNAFIRYTLLLLMTGWLLVKAGSSTALTCMVLGSGVLVGMRTQVLRNKVGRLWTYSAAAIVIMVILQTTGAWDFLVKGFAEMVGRDPSFHGRTAIWSALLKEDINPLFGVGYYSFWSPTRAQKLSEKYYYSLNEAHNGYLETYLNSGLVGLVLLIVVIGSAVNRIKNEVLDGSTYGAFRLALVLNVVFYGMSEAIFNRLSLLWLVLLMAILLPSMDDGVVVEEPGLDEDDASIESGAVQTGSIAATKADSNVFSAAKS